MATVTVGYICPEHIYTYEHTYRSPKGQKSILQYLTKNGYGYGYRYSSVTITLTVIYMWVRYRYKYCYSCCTVILRYL